MWLHCDDGFAFLFFFSCLSFIVVLGWLILSSSLYGIRDLDADFGFVLMETLCGG